MLNTSQREQKFIQRIHISAGSLSLRISGSCDLMHGNNGVFIRRDDSVIEQKAEEGTKVCDDAADCGKEG